MANNQDTSASTLVINSIQPAFLGQPGTGKHWVVSPQPTPHVAASVRPVWSTKPNPHAVEIPHAAKHSVVPEKSAIAASSMDCAKSKYELRNDPAAYDVEFMGTRSVKEAAILWLGSHAAFLRPRTIIGYQCSIASLDRFFRDMPLKDLGSADLRAYQDARAKNAFVTPAGEALSPWIKPGAPSIINHDLMLLQQVLRRAKLWKLRFADDYQPLPLPAAAKPKVMTKQEEERFFQTAATNQDYSLAALVARLTVHTTAAGSELRHLKWNNVDLTQNPPVMWVIDGTKNRYRERKIPLFAGAVTAMQAVMERAKEMGSTAPNHYLFPLRTKRNSWDPTKPASSSWLRNSFGALRDAADLPWLTPHCLRHQAITKMFELGVPIATIQSIAGHISAAMSLHYNHTRDSAKEEALKGLSGERQEPTPRIAVDRAPTRRQSPKRLPQWKRRRSLSLRAVAR